MMSRCRFVRPFLTPARSASFFKRSNKPASESEALAVDLEEKASGPVLPQRKPEAGLPSPRLADFDAASLAARGFLRNYKPYRPPSDVSARLEAVFSRILGGPNLESDQQLTDLSVKYRLLSACDEEFGQRVPNSMLHDLKTTADVKRFYSTAVDVRNPLEATRDMDLPRNLHVTVEPHRFQPQTDTMFGGVSAFPKSSTVVTGLKARKKFAGYKWKKTP